MAWQLSRPVGYAREAVHRLVAPGLGWLVGGPVVDGADVLSTLPRPALICPNHQSHLDIPVLRRALRGKGRSRLAVAAAEDYWFRKGLYRVVVSWFAAVPFHRYGGGGAESIRRVEELLAAGWRVVIFPEGTRSRSGRLGPFKAGVGLIATRTLVPVVPVRIEGLWDVLPPGRRRPRRGRVRVAFGAPLVADPGESPREFTSRLADAVAAL